MTYTILVFVNVCCVTQLAKLRTDVDILSEKIQILIFRVRASHHQQSLANANNQI